MSLLDRLLGRSAALTGERAQRLAAWRSLPEPDLDASPAAVRLVVVDVEATGLDLRSDRLIAIGAVAIRALRVHLGESFYAVLRQDAASSTENILVHGIGGTQQREGLEPSDALLDFLEFAGKSPLVAFHAGFDEAMIRRAMTAHLGDPFRRTWIDLADVAPQALPGEARRRRALDDWLALYGITAFSRHDAVADALATGQLLQAVHAAALDAGLDTLRKLRWDPGAARWAPR